MTMTMAATFPTLPQEIIELIAADCDFVSLKHLRLTSHALERAFCPFFLPHIMLPTWPEPSTLNLTKTLSRPNNRLSTNVRRLAIPSFNPSHPYNLGSLGFWRFNARWQQARLDKHLPRAIRSLGGLNEVEWEITHGRIDHILAALKELESPHTFTFSIQGGMKIPKGLDILLGWIPTHYQIQTLNLHFNDYPAPNTPWDRISLCLKKALTENHNLHAIRLSVVLSRWATWSYRDTEWELDISDAGPLPYLTTIDSYFMVSPNTLAQFTNLTWLSLAQPQEVPWSTFKSQDIHLKVLSVRFWKDAQTQEMMEYLDSYSGLRTLELSHLKMESENQSPHAMNQHADIFFGSVLERHGDTLKTIKICASDCLPWTVGRTAKSLTTFSSCSALEHLTIPFLCPRNQRECDKQVAQWIDHLPKTLSKLTIYDVINGFNPFIPLQTSLKLVPMPIRQGKLTVVLLGEGHGHTMVLGEPRWLIDVQGGNRRMCVRT